MNLLIPADFLLLIFYPRNISRSPLDPFSLSPFIMMEVFLQLSLPSLHSSSPLMHMYLVLRLIDWHCTIKDGGVVGWVGSSCNLLLIPSLFLHFSLWLFSSGSVWPFFTPPPPPPAYLSRSPGYRLALHLKVGAGLILQYFPDWGGAGTLPPYSPLPAYHLLHLNLSPSSQLDVICVPWSACIISWGSV